MWSLPGKSTQTGCSVPGSSLKNLYTGSVIWIELVILRNIYVYVCNNSFKKTLNLKESGDIKDGLVEGKEKCN